MQTMVVSLDQIFMKTKMVIKLNKFSKVVHLLLSNHQTVTFNTISTLVLILMIWLFAKSFVTKNFAIENIIDQSLMIQIIKGKVQNILHDKVHIEECNSLNLFERCYTCQATQDHSGHNVGSGDPNC